MNKDSQILKDCLLKVYGVLKFTQEEADEALKDFYFLQHLTIIEVLTKSLSKEEARQLEGIKQETDRQQQAQNFFGQKLKDPETDAVIKEALKKSVEDYLGKLTKLGDASQKKQVNEILFEVLKSL